MFVLRKLEGRSMQGHAIGLKMVVVCTLFLILATASHALNWWEEPAEEYQIPTIQAILYDRGFGHALNFPDGVVGPMTREAVRQFEEVRGDEVTGNVTTGLYFTLLDIGYPPDTWRWGAIAAAPSGAYASSWNYESREEVVKKVMAGCSSVAKPGEECAVASGYSDGSDITRWIADIYCRNSSKEGSLLVTSSSKKSAVDSVFQNALDSGFASAQCSLKTVIAADGSHK